MSGLPGLRGGEHIGLTVPNLAQAERFLCDVLGAVMIFDGGTIALIKDGDRITIDAEAKSIDVHIEATELEQRRSTWTQPAPYATRGTLAKYAKLVSSASEGAVTDK